MALVVRNRAYWACIAVLGLLASLQAVRLAQRRLATPTPLATFELGEQLPDLQLRSLRTSAFLRVSDMTARSPSRAACTLLVFFSTTCKFVMNVVPEWRGVAAVTRGNTTVPVVWVASSPSDTAAARFVVEHGLRQPAYAFGQEDDMNRFGVIGTPQAYIVDREGRLLDRPWPAAKAIVSFPERCRNPQ